MWEVKVDVDAHERSVERLLVSRRTGRSSGGSQRDAGRSGGQEARLFSLLAEWNAAATSVTAGGVCAVNRALICAPFPLLPVREEDAECQAVHVYRFSTTRAVRARWHEGVPKAIQLCRVWKVLSVGFKSYY